MPFLVSILIPAYNAQSWLVDTLDSALAQTWPRLEIIVVDDGSSDETLAIARSYASKGVIAVSQKNQGAAAARNHAFSLCKGDYIQWLDADDLLAPDKIEKQLAVLTDGLEKRTLLSSAWGSFAYRASKATFAPNLLWTDLSPIEWLLRKLGQNINMQTSAWLVSRELTEAAGPWNTQLLGDDDGEYFCRVLLASRAIKFVPNAKSFYRRVGGATLSSIGRSAKKLDAQFVALQLYIKYIQSLENSERVRLCCLSLLQTYMIYFYPERTDILRMVETLAAELGGELQVPEMPWKYDWIKKAFGWTAAKHAQFTYNRLKLRLLISWDKVLFELQQKPQAKT